MVDFLLLRGNVGMGGKAKIVAWDIIGGREQDFAELELKRDNDVVTIVPIRGAIALFPKQSKAAREPTKPTEPTEFCEGKTAAMMEAVNELARKQRKPQ